MNTQELLELLESGNVTVHTPETFQFKEVFNEMDTSMNPGMREFVSLDNPYVTMTFDTDFHDSGEPYCSVFATDETGDHMLLTEDERGNVVGHMNEVEYFINRNFDEGFYETQEAESKIDGWQDLVSPVDEDYERYIEQLALEENERMESEESWADDILSIDEEPPTLEELNEMNPPEEDLSNLSFEEQAEWIAEELQPGGKIDRFIEELKLGEKPSAQEKFELAGNDRNVSDTTKEYFKPSPEKQPYFDIMKTGFIPFEIREGYHGKDAAPDDIKISKEVINDIRMNVDPDFGYIAGVDTSKFHTRNEDGETKNVSIIPMTYEDLKPYMTETNLFEEKDVVSVRAIKEYGDRISVQGERFAVNNLVTFEVKLKNQEVHRSTMVIDDTGTALARMDFLATDLYHSFHIDTNNPYIGGDDLRLIHFEKLDRTNVENPGHFKCMDGKDENFRENFKKEIEDRIPGFLQDYCDRYGESLESGKFDVIDRKDYMEMRLDDISSAHKSLHNMTNITELYRESLEAKAYAANKRAGELDNEINLIDTERKKVSPDSEEYKTLSDKIENCKEKWADSYSEYKDLKQKYEEFSKDSAPIRDTYIDLNRQYEYLSKEYEQHFNNLDSNGISYEKPGIERTPQEQFSRLCDITVLRNDQVPTYLSVDAKDIISEKADVIRLAGEGLQDIVNAYNADIENPIEQIQFLGDERDPESISESNLYTASGYEIQAHSMTTDINRYLANNPEKNMETSKDTAIGEPHRPYIENSGHVDETNSKLYAGEKAEGSDKTRQEIREDFIDKAIYDGNSPESVTLTDRSTSEGMTDTGLYHEMEAMKQTIDAHPGEKVSDIDGFREEVLERKEQLDEQIPKPDIEEFGRTDSTDQEENPNHTDTNDVKNADFDNRIARSIHGARGAVDVEKKAEISKEKLSQLKQEAEQEAKETGRDKEEIFREKKEDLQYKLDKISDDIKHFKGKMESYNYVEPRFIGQHCGFQAAKAEFDSAIHLYEAIGGKVGDGAFVTKGVDSMMLFLSKMEFYGSNIATTMIIDRFADIDTVSNIRDIFHGDSGRDVNMYGGGLSRFLQNAVGIGTVIQTPAVFITQTIMRVMNWTPADIAKMMDKPYFQRDRDVDNDRTNDVSKEKQDTDKSEIRPDVEKQPDEAETADVSADDVEKQDIERTQPEGFVPDMDNHEEEKDAADRESEQNDIEKKDEEADETERSERENDKIEQEDIDGITSEVDKDSDSIEQKPEDKQEPDNIEKDETDTKESDDVEKEEQDDADAKESDDIEQAELDEIDPREPDKMEKEDDADSKEPDDIENDETDAKESDDIEKEEQKDADVKESDDTEQAEPDEIDTREPDKTEKEDDADSKEPDDIESTEADTEKSEDVKKEEPDEPEAVDKEASIESAGASENHSDMFENSLERNQTAEEGQKEQDAISEQTDIETETENDKSDAAVLENSMDILEDFVEPEEFEEQDNAAGENAVESEEENITMADRIESAVNGEEELDTVLEQVADDIMDGVEPEEAMSAILEGVSSAIEHGADAESVGDVIYEVSNMFGDSPIETMDTMLDTMAEHGIDSNMLEAVQEHVAEIYDSIETPFEDTAYGELDGVEFTEEDTVDSISGEADLDITYGTLDMFDSMMETADFDMIETDMQFVDHAEDMQDDFESQGFPNDIAADVSANMYEQMASDYDNGMDVFDDTYLQQLESQSLDSVQSMMGNSSDVNFEMDHVENGFETNPMEQQFGQDVQNIDYAPNDVDMNQMQQANMDYFNDFDNGFPLE